MLSAASFLTLDLAAIVSGLVYPELLGLCAAITVPNSGVNIHSSKENGTLHAYRHWWRVEITETEEEQIAFLCHCLM
jgi:hypothetical protein